MPEELSKIVAVYARTYVQEMVLPLVHLGRRAVSWPPHVVADCCPEYGHLTLSKQSFSFSFSVPTDRCIFFWSVCLRGDTNEHRETQPGTHGHGETRRPQIHTETRRSFL